MKKVILLVFVVLLCWTCHAQKAMTFAEADKTDVSMEKLDEMYKSGIHADPELGVFNNKKEAYTAAYQKLLQDLGSFLMENDFFWKVKTQAFNRIYFDEAGNIDYFLFNFRPGQVSKEEESRFRELVEDFSADYRFGLTAETKFAQCSPVTYAPTTKSD